MVASSSNVKTRNLSGTDRVYLKSSTGCLIVIWFFLMALRGRKIKNFDDISLATWSGGLPICVSSSSFQKSCIGWPQQPLTEKMLKFNLIFHDSNPKNIFLKHQNKAEFKNLDDSVILSCDFPGLKTSAASMTSTSSTTSMTLTASFHQKNYYSWWLDHSWHQNDQ